MIQLKQGQYQLNDSPEDRGKQFRREFLQSVCQLIEILEYATDDVTTKRNTEREPLTNTTKSSNYRAQAKFQKSIEDSDSDIEYQDGN